jgi:hydroxyacylglutathione hydrolase
MRVIDVRGRNNIYSSNVYLVTGDWKKLEDLNTLIDVGGDPSILDTIDRTSTGVGKNKIDQVILTHSHSDHTSNLPLIRERYRPKVFAYSPFIEGVDHLLSNGDLIRIGDRMFEVLHTPGHSSDSVSLFNDDEGVLFVGDTPVVIRTAGGSYEANFITALKALCRRRVHTIYFGHGEPITKNAHAVLLASLKNVHRSKAAKALAIAQPEGNKEESRPEGQPEVRDVAPQG